MIVIYAQQPLPTNLTKSIFLAGPTSRTEEDTTWRKLALNVLYNMGYDGVVIVPEPKPGVSFKDITQGDGYEKQVEWEEMCLNAADRIIFWVARNMEGMPGLTTNDEFGTWKHSGKCILGTPNEAEHVRYQQYYAKKLNIPLYNNLYLALSKAVTDLGFGYERLNTDVKIPVDVWKHPGFKSWYKSLLNTGNKLEDAKVLWSFSPGGKMFAFILKATIWIENEQRYKNNEFFFGRTDISSCVIYSKPDNNLLNTEVVIVSEYRVPVRNSKSMVYELPGGSSPTDENPLQTVCDEIKEETGLIIEPNRLMYNGFRQLQATTLSHGSHLYSVEIDQFEMELVKSRIGNTYGKIEDTELTYLNVMNIGNILSSDIVDYSNIGMIMNVLLIENKN